MDVKETSVTKKRRNIADAELAVMKVLWAKGPLTAKEITEAIYPDGAESEFASVHSFLQRLEKKKLVDRDRSSFAHSFRATVSQTDVAGQELESLADRLSNGSMAPFITHLLRRKRLTKKEVEQIQKLLNSHLR